MKANAILINKKDNVITVVDGVNQGEEVRYFSEGKLLCMVALEDIPPCNKIAISPIENGEHIIKYGEIIGASTEAIAVGHSVSHLNIISLPRDYASELK